MYMTHVAVDRFWIALLLAALCLTACLVGPRSVGPYVATEVPAVGPVPKRCALAPENADATSQIIIDAQPSAAGVHFDPARRWPSRRCTCGWVWG